MNMQRYSTGLLMTTAVLQMWLMVLVLAADCSRAQYIRTGPTRDNVYAVTTSTTTGSPVPPRSSALSERRIFSSRNWDPSVTAFGGRSWDPSNVYFDTRHAAARSPAPALQQDNLYMHDADIVHFRPSHLRDISQQFAGLAQQWASQKNIEQMHDGHNNVGSWCRLPNGVSSRCAAISDCPTALDDLVLYGQTPIRCGFRGKEEVVCCPDDAGGPPKPRPGGPWRPNPWNWAGENNNHVVPPSRPTPGKPRPSTGRPGMVNVPVPSTGTYLPPTKPTKINSGVGRKAEEACQRFLAAAGPSIVPLIKNGEDARLTEFPHMALLGYPYNGVPNYLGHTKEGRQVTWGCGGTLISDRFVLTAAHCLTDLNKQPFVVRLGELDWGKEEQEDGARPEDVAIKRIILHPEYRSELAYHDIALLELARPVRFYAAVQPACLPAAGQAIQTRLTVTGWGDVDFATDMPSKQLLKATLNLVPLAECNRSYTGTENSRKLPNALGRTGHMCARDSRGLASACLGDSGGPLTEDIAGKNNNLHRVVGVTSLGKLCSGTSPTLFTKVADYVPWIEKIVWP